MAIKKRRRPLPLKAKAEAENKILEKSRWTQFTANSKLHSDDKNNAARWRCRQLIDCGVAAVDWLELYGQKC